MYVCAVIHIERRQNVEASANLSQAERLFDENGDVEGAARVALMRGHVDMQRGEYQDASIKARRVYEERDDMPHIRAAERRVMGIAQLKRGSVVDAIRDFETARPIYEEHSDRFALTKLLTDLDVAYRQTGRISDAADCLQAVVTIRRE